MLDPLVFLGVDPPPHPPHPPTNNSNFFVNELENSNYPVSKKNITTFITKQYADVTPR